MKTHPNLNKLIALTGALILSVLLMSRAEEKEKTDENKAQLMFVQTADDFKADGKTLRLVNVGQQTLYFSDRPVRIAGHRVDPVDVSPHHLQMHQILILKHIIILQTIYKTSSFIYNIIKASS